MTKHLFKQSASVLAAASVLALSSACVNEEYDLTDIDTTVAFGGEALVFPLGSTEYMKLETLLSEEDFDYLVELDGGVYGFQMEDNLDLSEEIPDIASELQMEPVRIDESFGHTIDIDMTSMNIEETRFPADGEGDITFSDVEIPDIDNIIPAGPYSQSVKPELPDVSQMDLDLDLQSYEMSSGNLYDPSELSQYIDALPVGDDEPVTIDEQWMDMAIPLREGDAQANISVHIELDESLSDIQVTELSDQARMIVTATLDNSFFSSGTVTPKITLKNIGEIVTLMEDDGFDPADGSLDLGRKLAFNADGSVNPTARYEYAITGLGDMQWTGNVLDKNISISALGDIRLSGVTTTKALVSNSGALGIDVSIAFENVEIEDMTMQVGQISEQENTRIDLGIEPVTLQDPVQSVGEILMEDNSFLNIMIGSEGMAHMPGLDAKLGNLDIKFPDEIKFGDYQGLDRNSNTLSMTDIDLMSESRISLPVLSIVPPAPVDNQIVFDGQVLVEAAFSAGGEVTLSGLRQAAEPAVNFNVEPDIRVANYNVAVNPVEHDVDIREDMSIQLPENMEDIGTVKVTPDNTKSIIIDIAAPELQDLEIAGDNLKISFPDMIVFKDVDGSYGYDPSDNSLNFNGALPQDPITLDIDCIRVVPEKDETGTGYVASGEVSITGKAVLRSVNSDNSVRKSDIEAIFDETSGGISVSGTVPAINIAECTVEMERFEVQVDETVSVDIFDTGKLPEGIESITIDQVLLKDSELNLGLIASSLPDLDSDPKLDIEVQLPPEIVTGSDLVDSDNVLHLTGTFSENEYHMEPVAITSIDLSNVDLMEGGMIARDIVITGRIYVEAPSISDPESLNGTEVSVNVTGDMNVGIDKITGNLGYKIGEDGSDNMSQEISLEDLPEFMKGEDFVLDFTNPHIILDVESNVGIPVKGTVAIVPVYGDTQDDSKKQTLEITIPKADGVLTTTSFWVSAEDNAPSGYNWLKADIPALLRQIPDKLQIDITAETDPDEKFEVVTFIDEDNDGINDGYTFSLGYNVVVPFEFGEDLDIKMDITYPDSGDGEQAGDGTEGGDTGSETLPPVLGELLNMNSLGLGGEIESTLPLQMRLVIELLDSEKKVIATEPMSMNIAAGREGDPSISPIDMQIKLAQGADGKDLSYIKLNFEITSGNMSGEPVTKDSYIRATLKAKVPGGVTIDLSELGESENSESETEN